MIYLDMDGVLADFDQQAFVNLNVHKNTQWFDPPQTWTPENRKGEDDLREAMHTPGFWAGIPVLGKAKELWDYCAPHHPMVVSAKPRDDSPAFIKEEKLAWLNQHMGEFPADRLIVCRRRDKIKYMKQETHFATGNHILVDDQPRNCKAWVEAGGVAILFSGDVNDTIFKLENYIHG